MWQQSPTSANSIDRNGDADANRPTSQVSEPWLGDSTAAMHATRIARLADPARLGALRASGLLDSPPEEAFDRLTKLATRLIGAPVALVSLVTEDRQFFKSCVGLAAPWSDARETPLSHSFCQHVVASNAPLVIEDARAHPLVSANLAIPDLGAIAYAGVPLTTAEGHTLGSFCVIDIAPRRWTADELATLGDLAAAAITEIALRTALNELAQERDLARQVVATMGQGLTITDGDERFSYVNPAFAQMLGYQPADLLGTRPIALVDPADHAALHGVQRERKRGVSSSYAQRLRHRNGEMIHTLVNGVLHQGGVGSSAVIVNLTELRRMEGALLAAQQRLTAHVENSAIAVIECTPDFRILRWSPGAERTFGWTSEAVLGRYANRDFPLLYPDDAAAVAQVTARLLDGRDERNVFYNRNLTKDGRVIHCEWHNSVLRDVDGAVVSIFSLALDVTAQIQLQEQLAHQALHDPLTGLPNRASLAGRFRQLLAREERFAILFIDLDGFKGVNDRLGHAAGDELLHVVARRLQRAIRTGDVVARLGGDEFVVLAEGGCDEAECLALAQRLAAVIARSIAIGGERVQIKASIGVSRSAPDQRDPDELLLIADAAMYTAKQRGTGPYLVTQGEQVAAAAALAAAHGLVRAQHSPSSGAAR